VGLITEQRLPLNKALGIVFLFLVLGLPVLADLRAGQAAYDAGDYATALNEFLPLAQRGDAVAQLDLGWMYFSGRGVPQDSKEAVRWYRAAAEQGEPNAQVNLGWMYDHGRGVPQDYTEAVRWYRAAAEQGDSGGQVDLGRMYENGLGVSQDYIQAHMWFNLAAASGDATAAKEAIKERDSIASNMTPEQISEAQRLAREWKPKRNK